MITRQPLAISLSPVLLPVAKVALLLGVVLCLAQPGRADITEYAIAATNGVTVWGSSTINGSVGSALGDVSLFSSDLAAPTVNGVVSGRYVALFGGGTRVNGA